MPSGNNITLVTMNLLTQKETLIVTSKPRKKHCRFPNTLLNKHITAFIRRKRDKQHFRNITIIWYSVLGVRWKSNIGVLPTVLVYIIIPGDLWACNFEAADGSMTMCDLEQDTHDDKADWKLWHGNTPALRTGPKAAYNGKYYIYLDATHGEPADEAKYSYMDTNTNTTTQAYTKTYTHTRSRANTYAHSKHAQ